MKHFHIILLGILYHFSCTNIAAAVSYLRGTNTTVTSEIEYDILPHLGSAPIQDRKLRIIGPDDRRQLTFEETKSWPWRVVGRVLTFAHTKIQACTGTLIGPR